MRARALQLVQDGFAVLPCYPGTKMPALENWAERPLTDPWDVLENWPGEGFNVGVATGRGIVVIDVDNKPEKNKDGIGELRKLPPLPLTLTVRTPSGGRHYYFRAPSGVEYGNSVDKIARGIDVRGLGGQVIAPGSEVGGKKYEVETAAPIAPLPDWLAERITAAPTREASAGSVLGELDTPPAIERARALILRTPPAVEGCGGNDATYRLCVKLFDFGLKPETVFDLLQDWNAECSPPWDDSDLERIIGNAREYKKAEVGRDNPLAGMVQIEKPPNPFGAGVRIWSREIEDFAAIPPRPWLAEKRLLRGKISLLVAPGSAGKSLLTLQWATSMALGPGAGEFCGLKPRERTNVLCVNMEDDIEEMEMRLAAMTSRFRLPHAEVKHRVHLWSGQTPHVAPFKIARKDGRTGTIQEGEIVQHLIDYCRENGIGTVIVDPLVDTHDCDENSNGDVQRVMQIYRRVATELNAAVLLVHHTKKPSSASAEAFAGSADAGRGASAAVNAARIGLTLFTMNAKEGERYNIPPQERHRYARLDDAKANLFLATGNAQWFKRVSVDLANGEQVGVLEPFVPVDGSQAEHRAVLEALALRLSLHDRVPVKTAATRLREDGAFMAYTADGLVSKVIAACESGDPTHGNKTFVYERVGKNGGSIAVRPRDEV